MKNTSLFPKFLFAGYVILFTILAIHPYSRDVWFAENTPIVLIAGSLFVLYLRGVQFSNLSYAFMFVLLYMHTIGGYYTFERVPFDWFDDFFGFERNMYDRVAHFTVGLYAFPLAEYIRARKLANTEWLTYLTPLFFVMSVAASYELIEWWYAASEGGSAGAAFLGSQGDIWDAQKDIFMDTLGGIFALICFSLESWRERLLR